MIPNRKGNYSTGYDNLWLPITVFVSCKEGLQQLELFCGNQEERGGGGEKGKGKRNIYLPLSQC